MARSVGRPASTEEEIREREALGAEIREFMAENLFTEKKLADLLGVSRRSMQMMKAGRSMPHKETFDRLQVVFSKYRRMRKTA